METLLEDYKRKLKTAESMLENGMTFGDEQENRIKIKASVYRTTIVDIERAMARQQQQGTANCAIFDVSKRYRFTMQDVDTNEIIIIDEDTERKAFRKAFRFLGEKKARDRELNIVSKVDNVC